MIRNALFRLPARASNRAIPWVTFTDPELATVGLSENDARARGIVHEIVRCAFADNDRAQAERATEGLVKVVVGRGGRVLGASMVGTHAGELILPWVLAVERRLKLRAMASLVVPYPTLSEVSKRVAGSLLRTKAVQCAGPLAGAPPGQARMSRHAARRWLPLLALVVLGVAVYASGLHRELSLDDAAIPARGTPGVRSGASALAHPWRSSSSMR